MRTTHIIIALFLLSAVGDIVTTLAVKFTKQVFNESNPLFNLGVPVEVLMITKLVIYLYLAWYLIYRYNLNSPIFLRYLIIYMVTAMLLLNFVVAYSNSKVLQIPDDQIVPIPPEQRTEIYMDQIGDMEIVKQPGIPLIFQLFILNMLQFFIWQRFEKDARSPRVSTQ